MSNLGRSDVVEKLEPIIKYRFNDKTLLLHAVTHSSYANENKNFKSNERLEFLGDTVLDIVISEYLFRKYPDLPEGELSKMRAAIVCEQTICNCALALNLGECLLLGKGEEQNGGRHKVSLISDMFEAIVGAIYIDGGLNSAQDFLLRTLKNYLDNNDNICLFFDYKTSLQEILQKQGTVKIEYETDNEYGPEHDKTFEASIRVDGHIIGKGKGKTKKEAEQDAARNAINKIEKL